MLPFAINGLNWPAAMLEIDQFGVGVGLGVKQRGEQPTWPKPRPLVTKQACAEDFGEVGVLPAGSGGGMKLNDPLVIPQTPVKREQRATSLACGWRPSPCPLRGLLP